LQNAAIILHAHGRHGERQAATELGEQLLGARTPEDARVVLHRNVRGDRAVYGGSVELAVREIVLRTREIRFERREILRDAVFLHGVFARLRCADCVGHFG